MLVSNFSQRFFEPITTQNTVYLHRKTMQSFGELVCVLVYLCSTYIMNNKLGIHFLYCINLGYSLYPVLLICDDCLPRPGCMGLS